MKTRQFKMALLIIALIVLQLILNNLTILYVDALGVLIVILLLNNYYSMRVLIILTLIADLIGHWYLGTHLLATILISFLIGYLEHFYKICSNMQKNFLCGLIYSLLTLIIVLIGLITHNSSFSWLSYFTEILLLNPLILWVFQRFTMSFSSDFVL